MPKVILIIADDLTGAADSAVAFAERGFSTEVLIEAMLSGHGDADVIAVTTETRDVQVDELPGKFDVLRSGGEERLLLFKKIDSMLRGNTCAEIELATQILPDHTVIISPAYPKLGRVCIAGQIHWRDGAGEGVIDLRDRLHRRGMQPISLSAGADTSSLVEVLKGDGESKRLFLHEATTNEDLLALAGAGRSLGRPVLWIGSGGLAHALAEQFPRPSTQVRQFEPRAGTGLLFVGSDHPVTKAQVEMLRDGSLTDVSMIQVRRGDAGASDIRAAVLRCDPQNISFIFMTGGDTAMQVCRALGVASLKIESEYAPGVPVGRMQMGLLDGVAAVLKSGGFGEPDLLRRLCGEFRAPGRVNA
ncbi:MAG TPA: four-carbon acid sugar kinase family protein [Terracidiphilus sp.]